MSSAAVKPAAALDPLGRRDVLEVMKRLRSDTTVFYSTHILDDVQQVSDEVAILDRGRRVLQGPMQQVLAVDAGLVFDLVLDGNVTAAESALHSQPWVVDVHPATHVAGGEGAVALSVRVDDPAAARERLLRAVLASDDVQVLSFGPRVSELEDVFIDLVEGRAR